ncbi:hypothetical protein PV677_36270 [Streptomyces sp. DE06-01C]|uniref:hypothetical protein n=1 Tax=Streptomyces sp. DE06-01C TaxID=3028656 RepID=UPI0029C32E1E|nr:hypothetical protein [Streptomyces sp. DE06-01C]MDX5526128.1 hypothetical protein [Streptomyces sp. DE06-01C]
MATISLCKHRFPVQPPLGSIGHPGDCSSCGATWDEVQANLHRQHEALIFGSARDGNCPDCAQPRRLFRFQPFDKPWTPIGFEEPVTFLCMDCWNTATEADHEGYDALLDAI